MLSLLRIRIKYIKVHLTSFIIYYLIIPGLLLITSIILKIKSKRRENLITFEKTNSYQKGEYLLFQNNDKKKYSKLSYYLNELSLISKDEKECKSLAEFMKNETYDKNAEIPMNKTEFKCYKDEKELPPDEDAIVIIKEEEKYEFQLLKHNRFTMFDSKLLSTELTVDLFNVEYLKLINESGYKYKYPIYLDFQSLIAKYLIKKKLGESFPQKFKNKNMNITLGINPYPEYTNFYTYLGQEGKMKFLFIYFFLISFLFSMYTYFFNIRMIEEKEKKLNLLLRRYGVSNIKYFFSWFIPYLVLNLLFIISLYLLSSAYLPLHSHLFLINIILYILSLFSASYFFYLCIYSVRAGYTILKIYYLGLSVLGCAIAIEKTSRTAKIIFAIIPQINIFHCSYAIYELQIFKSLSWDKLWLKANKVAFVESIIMYITDIILYSILSMLIYIYKYSKFRLNLSIKSIFFKSKLIAKKDSDLMKTIGSYHQDLSSKNQEKKNNNKSLKLEGITKSYDEINIIENFNAEFFSDEIFCLIGNNGAGKTTLINIISGIIKPDEGHMAYNGTSFNPDKSYFYQNISLCQQENIYFDYLTVSEHLELLQSLKFGSINNNEIHNMIKQFDLEEKENYSCGTLSGGQKRKLCIALALIGKSKIILLDEPTSGMDPLSKKNFWEIIKSYKTNRTILITTHSLEDAENIGDRIGFMADGDLICSGSSSFLKEKYPCGLTINIILNTKNKIYEENSQKIFDKIKNYEEDLQIKFSYKGILSINIKSDNKNIPQIFEAIEESKEEFGIEDYMVSTTSLEDIFLKINNRGNLKNDEYVTKISDSEDDNKLIIKNNNIIIKGFCSQLWSQLKRDLIPLKRNYILFIIELITSLFTAYVLIFFFFKKWMLELTRQKNNLDLIKVLETNTNYIYDKNNILINSYAYKSSKNIELKKISQKSNNIYEFMELVYNNSFNNIAKGSICIQKNIDNNLNKTVYNIYNTEIYSGNYGNVYANTMFFVSAFLKKEYDIDASILTKISFKKVRKGKMDHYEIIENGFDLLIIELCALFGFLFFLTSLTTEKIKERKYNIKRLIYISGGNLTSYWLSFFILDFIKIIIFIFLLMIPISYINGSGIYIFLNLIFYSISCLIFIYFISFLCTKEDIVIKFCFLYIMVFLGFGFISRKYKLERNFADTVLQKKFVFTSFDFNPITAIGFSWFRIIYHYCVKSTYNDESGLQPVTIVLLNGIVIQIFNLIIYGLLFFSFEKGFIEKLLNYLKNIIILKEKQNFLKGTNTNDFMSDNIGPLLENRTDSQSGISMSGMNDYDEDEEIVLTDEDNFQKEIKVNKGLNNDLKKRNSNSLNDPSLNQYVMNEMDRIRGELGFLTRIQGIKKTFWFCCKKKILAINKLYLGLNSNEKFGLLGYNGSGKTVTFKMIINEILYDTGSITLFGFDNRNQFNNINSKIGYCPQENPLFEFMKVKDIIKFFAELKNIEENDNVENICKKFGLIRYLDTLCINLSGGNRRKLALAIALMNKPSLLLLDEPSTGMDPESKRIMWKNIKKLIQNNERYNLILSTHSIDEAELLCDRISWFKNGNFIYLGNSEQLKLNNITIYKLYIKFDQSKFIIEELDKDKINESLNIFSKLVKNFDSNKYDLDKPELEPQIRELINIINKIKENTKNIYFKKGFPFYFELEILKEQRKEFFCKIVELKNTNQKISEINIEKESLENIINQTK